MTIQSGRLFRGGVNRCREWAFYVVGALICEVSLIALWITQSDADFIRLSRTFGVIGIGVTVAYKLIVIAVMSITRPKTALDRRLIWHMASLDAFMVYAFIANVYPQAFGLPKPAPFNPPENPELQMIVAAVVWYNIIGFVMWSAIAVLNALYHERWRYVRIGVFRTLKIRVPGIIERATDADTETADYA